MPPRRTLRHSADTLRTLTARDHGPARGTDLPRTQTAEYSASSRCKPPRSYTSAGRRWRPAGELMLRAETPAVRRAAAHGGDGTAHGRGRSGEPGAGERPVRSSGSCSSAITISHLLRVDGGQAAVPPHGWTTGQDTTGHFSLSLNPLCFCRPSHSSTSVRSVPQFSPPPLVITGVRCLNTTDTMEGNQSPRHRVLPVTSHPPPLRVTSIGGINAGCRWRALLSLTSAIHSQPGKPGSERGRQKSQATRRLISSPGSSQSAPSAHMAPSPVTSDSFIELP